jgi:hypothetical protein
LPVLKFRFEHFRCFAQLQDGIEIADVVICAGPPSAEKFLLDLGWH